MSQCGDVEVEMCLFRDGEEFDSIEAKLIKSWLNLFPPGLQVGFSHVVDRIMMGEIFCVVEIVFDDWAGSYGVDRMFCFHLCNY